MSMNIEQARFNMVEQQVRPWDVLDARILDLLFQVRREDFVPPAWRALAFADLEIPLGHGQSMLSPKMEARMVQEVALEPTDRVLEIGSGSGYVAALLGHLAAEVLSVEIIPEFVTAAAARLALAAAGRNVRVVQGDGARDWAAGSPWNVILLSGSVPSDPLALLERLAPDGRLLAVVGDAPMMHACLWSRRETGFAKEVLFETVIPPLSNAPEPIRFSF
jgi:protein-L-isoaspartate(D-aspartate) O-methyltransferase